MLIRNAISLYEDGYLDSALSSLLKASDVARRIKWLIVSDNLDDNPEYNKWCASSMVAIDDLHHEEYRAMRDNYNQISPLFTNDVARQDILRERAEFYISGFCPAYMYSVVQINNYNDTSLNHYESGIALPVERMQKECEEFFKEFLEATIIEVAITRLYCGVEVMFSDVEENYDAKRRLMVRHYVAFQRYLMSETIAIIEKYKNDPIYRKEFKKNITKPIKSDDSLFVQDIKRQLCNKSIAQVMKAADMMFGLAEGDEDEDTKTLNALLRMIALDGINFMDSDWDSLDEFYSYYLEDDDMYFSDALIEILGRDRIRKLKTTKVYKQTAKNIKYRSFIYRLAKDGKIEKENLEQAIKLANKSKIGGDLYVVIKCFEKSKKITSVWIKKQLVRQTVDIIESPVRPKYPHRRSTSWLKQAIFTIKKQGGFRDDKRAVYNGQRITRIKLDKTIFYIESNEQLSISELQAIESISYKTTYGIYNHHDILQIPTPTMFEDMLARISLENHCKYQTSSKDVLRAILSMKTIINYYKVIAKKAHSKEYQDFISDSLRQSDARQLSHLKQDLGIS